MKKIWGITGIALLSLLGISAARQYFETPKEQKVVELHITRYEQKEENAGFKTGLRTVPLGKGICSGAFVDSNGGILTARHCTERATSIEVQTFDGKLYTAVLVVTAPTHDLALIRISRRNTPYFDLAKDVVRGQTIYALGSPLGITDTLSKGIIAKLAGDLILGDLSVLPGNSGCPALNENGEMVGIVTAVFVMGMGTTHLSVIQGLDVVSEFLWQNN